MIQDTALVFSPRWEYGDSPDETARELRDEAMAVAALAHRLSPDNIVQLQTSLSPDVDELEQDGLFEQSFALFDHSLTTSDQSIFSRFVTRHHRGRAELLAAHSPAGDVQRGLSEIRFTLPTIRREAKIGNDAQALVNVLGGAMLAEAGFGRPHMAHQHRVELREVVSAVKRPQIDITSFREAMRALAVHSRERLKHRANSAAALAIVSLYDIIGAEDTAQSLTQRALRGPILHKPVE
jgi:hypothetical protein